MSTHRVVIAVCTLAVLLSTACAQEAPSGAVDGGGGPARVERADNAAALPVRNTGATQLPDFTVLVEQYGDAVVNVDVVGRPQQAGGGGRGGPDPLEEFFRRFGIPMPEGGGPGGPGGPGAPGNEAPVLRGSGSGFIVSADGYILTNAHVVASADEVTVRLTDRREFQAKVVGTDTRTDVAVLKIDADNLPTVRVGDPTVLKTGEWVLAIGSPFGLENTATAGIVSGTSRAVSGDVNVPFIQTDVAVNPGNSGGPLFNLNGEVVGINSMIFSRSGGYMGISFAIPIDVAMQVRDQLVKHGRVVRGRIGVTVQDVDASLARSFALDRPRGALISSVEADGPAEKAGLKPGDVVLAAAGKPVDTSAGLSHRIASMAPGTETKLSVWRDGKEREFDVKIAELEAAGAPLASERGAQGNDESTKLGVVVRALTPDEKRAARTEGSIIVEQVRGPAARAGLRPGDVILSVNNRAVRSVQDLRTAAKALRAGDAAALLVQRGNAQIFVPVRAG